MVQGVQGPAAVDLIRGRDYRNTPGKGCNGKRYTISQNNTKYSFHVFDHVAG